MFLPPSFRKPMSALMGTVLTIGGFALAAPASAVVRLEPPADAVTAPEVDNELFTIDVSRVVLQVGIGRSASGTSTFTAKRELSVSTTQLPSAPTDQASAKLTGVCPVDFQAIVMHAGDACTIEYTFAPQYGQSAGLGGWRPRAVPIAADGTPEGAAIAATISGCGMGQSLVFAPIDLGEVQSGDVTTVSLDVTNITALDLPLLAPQTLPLGLSPMSDAQFPVSLPAGETTTIPFRYEATLPGASGGGFFMQASVPKPPSQASSPTSFLVRAAGTVSVAPLTATDADFGEVEEGVQTERTVTVTNTGGAPATITAAVDDPTTGVVVDAFDEDFQPGQSKDVTLRWVPDADAPTVATDVVFTDAQAPVDQTRTAVVRVSGTVISEAVPPIGPGAGAGPGSAAGSAPSGSAAGPDARLATTGTDLRPVAWLAPLALVALGGAILLTRGIGSRRRLSR